MPINAFLSLYDAPSAIHGTHAEKNDSVRIDSFRGHVNMKKMRRRLYCGVVTCLLWLPCSSLGESQDTSTPLTELKKQADILNRDGQFSEAAQVYEKIIQADPSSSNMITSLLVDLYIKSRQPEKAVNSARSAMASSTDPNAYLASVYTKLNMFNEAIAVIENELKTETLPNRRMALLFQQVQVYEKAGNLDAAQSIAQNALDESAGTAHEAAAKRLVEQLQVSASKIE